AGSTVEQRKAGEMVVGAVERISDVAKENLDVVRELEKAAENMKSSALSLGRSISFFKTDRAVDNEL
ncbi:MAG TPA: hypothetical protein VJM83_01755, partial [Nitrospirota bacterium]|nr:hypothetical protein [Nitrospirota bacterium]